MNGDPSVRRARRAWVVLAGSLLLSLGAAALVGWSARAREEARFQNASQGASDRVLGRLEVYGATLRGLAGLYAASDSVTAGDFRAFAQRIDVTRRFPGVQGLGWSERIRLEPERHAIQYLYPLDARNRAALDFDMYAEPTRREAMARARDTGEPALSGRVTLVQEIAGPRQAGFLLYLPVYRGGAVPPTVAARRRLLQGFVFAPFRADDLFAGIFGSEVAPRVAFRIYDGTRADSAALLHHSLSTPGHEPEVIGSRRLMIAGRPWLASFTSEPTLERGSMSYLGWVVLGVGMLISALLFALVRVEARARWDAEAANVSKSRFLATMSHELRTPLNAISGYAELLELGVYGPVTAAQVGAVERIKLAQGHLLGLIEDVLTFAKLEAGRVAFRLQEMRVHEVVDAAEPLIATQASARGVRFGRLDGPTDLRVCVDPERVRQILLNLLSNAVKFTEPGGAVEVGWGTRGADVHLWVRDTGIGIDPDQLEAVFAPFTQVDGDLTRVHAGTGLGLAISRELARAMGGDVLAVSEPGRGSTFTLRLPKYG